MYFLDKAHNLILDRLLTFGLLGVLVWLGLYLYPVLRGWRGTLLQRSLATSLLAVFVYYLFWFPVPQVEPLHLVLIAAAWALLAQNPALTGMIQKNIPLTAATPGRPHQP